MCRIPLCSCALQHLPATGPLGTLVVRVAIQPARPIATAGAELRWSFHWHTAVVVPGRVTVGGGLALAVGRWWRTWEGKITYSHHAEMSASCHCL